MKPSTMEIFKLFCDSRLINPFEVTFNDLAIEHPKYEALRADHWNFREFYTYQADKLAAYVSMIRLNLSKAWLMQQHCVLYQRQGLGLGVIQKLYEGVKNDPEDTAYMFGPFFHDNAGPAAIWAAAEEIVNDKSMVSIADYRLSMDGTRLMLIDPDPLHLEMLETCDLDCINPFFSKPIGMLQRRKIKGIIIKHTPEVKERFKAIFK
jgi:hypothetical protein